MSDLTKEYFAILMATERIKKFNAGMKLVIEKLEEEKLIREAERILNEKN